VKLDEASGGVGLFLALLRIGLLQLVSLLGIGWCLSGKDMP
jgi:hypothetical protein